MKKIALRQLPKMKSPEIITIIKNWKRYDPRIVLIAYSELHKRKYNISQTINSKTEEFCNQFNHSNINEFLNTYLKDDNYYEFYKKGIKEYDGPKEAPFYEKYFPKISFGSIILMFFLPFFLIKCGGEPVGNLSGFQLVTGTEFAGHRFSNEHKIDMNIFAIISFLSAISGLIIAFTQIEKAKIISLGISIIGLISLILLYNQLNNEVSSEGEGMVTIALGIGYYLAFLGYLINSIFFGYAVKEEHT